MQMILSSLKCAWFFGGYDMRHIIKTDPPQEFIEYCETPGVSFDGLSGVAKDALRKRLLEDQGYICCYCGRKIYNDKNTKIEHVKCQKNYKELSLCFENMLASCDGGDKDRENNVKHQLHCDAKKENKDIPISPLENIDGYLSFFEDGTVKGRGEIGRELIRILGLDAKFLNTQRKNAIDKYELCFPDDLESELLLLKQKHDGCYEEFCFVLEQYVLDLINERDEKTTCDNTGKTNRLMAVNY